MYEIPAHVTYQDAALVEPLACVLRGLEETVVSPGDTIAVIGLGPIGLMFVRLAKVYGARVIWRWDGARRNWIAPRRWAPMNC